MKNVADNLSARYENLIGELTKALSTEAESDIPNDHPSLVKTFLDRVATKATDNVRDFKNDLQIFSDVSRNINDSDDLITNNILNDTIADNDRLRLNLMLLNSRLSQSSLGRVRILDSNILPPAPAPPL